MRVGFTPISADQWTGGQRYLLNLLKAIHTYARDRLEAVLFVGAEMEEAELQPYRPVVSEIVRSEMYDRRARTWRLARAILMGTDRAAERFFKYRHIDVVFEPATFYGWRFSLPAIAWFPDLQHRLLPHMFGKWAYWKRDLGLRAQVRFGRLIMLSSEATRAECERLYPTSRGSTAVVRFAVSFDEQTLVLNPMQVATEYRLPENFFYLPNQFWKHKNHKVVIEAVRLLKETGRTVVVAASGKPEDPRHPTHYADLVSLFQGLGLKRNFIFLGMIPYRHLVALMRAAAAVINPSLSEGWSTTVEEAKSLGVPMILSDLPVHREQAGSTAVYFRADSPADLAHAISEIQPLSPTERAARERVALSEADVRVRKFASDFETVVMTAASKHA